MAAIHPRSSWGARHERGAGPAPIPAAYLYAHHSVTAAPPVTATFAQDAAAVRTLENIGESRFGRGISYTFAICPSGRIFEGHGVDRLGSHTKGRNTTGRALVFIGNYETSQLSPQAVETAAQLIAHGYLAGWWKATGFTGGHRDAPGAATACPGRHVMSQLGAINARAAAIARGAAKLPAAPAPAPVPLPSHREVQELLAKAGLYTAKIDGINGPKQKAAVTAWQEKLGITADGVWGPQTQRKTEDLFRWLAAVAEKEDPVAKWVAGIRARALELLPRVRALPNLNGNSSGHEVSTLQETINFLIFAGALEGVAALAVDGIYGRKTIDAVFKFQAGLYGGARDFPGAAHEHTRWWLVAALEGMAS